MDWQPMENLRYREGNQVLLGRAGWGAVLAEWDGSHWRESLGGELYGTSIPFEPTHGVVVTEPPAKK
jgi:hypothetical protein